jgi:transposase
MAAWSLFRSQSALGANFRRLRRKLGAPKAVTAMAHKLARLVYRMLKFGQAYVDKGMEHYEAKYRHQQIKYLFTASDLGGSVSPCGSGED